MPHTLEMLSIWPENLDEWIKPFSEIEVSEDLLRETFSENPPPSFFRLYQACLKLRSQKLDKRLAPKDFNKIDASWQLICLSGDVKRVKRLPEADSLHDNLGAGPLHYVALSGSRSAIAHCLKQYPLNAVDAIGRNLLHYTAWSGSQDALGHVFSFCREFIGRFINSRDAIGRNALHYAALSGMPNAIQYVLDARSDHPEFLIDKFGCNLAHYAAWSGSQEAIKYVLRHHREHAMRNTRRGSNLLHFAVLSGSRNAIESVAALFPDFLKSQDENGFNFLLHLVVFWGSREVIETALRYWPELAEGQDKRGRNLLHLAALSRSLEVVACVLEKYPHLAESKDKLGRNLLHVAAFSGSVEVIKYVLEKYPHLAKSKDANGANMLHLAALSHSQEALHYILSQYPEFTESEDDEGNNLLHYIATAGCRDLFEFVLRREPGPKVVARLWKQNKKGRTPDNLWAYHNPSGVSLRDIKLQLLKEKIYALFMSERIPEGKYKLGESEQYVRSLMPERIIKGIFSKELEASLESGGRVLMTECDVKREIEILETFQRDCQTLLINDEEELFRVSDIQRLLDDSTLPETFLKILLIQKCLLLLKSIETKEKPLTKALLKELVDRTKDVFDSMSRSVPSSMFFGAIPESGFFKDLIAHNINLLASEGGEVTEKSMMALSVIIDDYQRAPSNPDTQTVDTLFAGKILETSDMCALRPQPTVSKGRDITPRTYAKHMDTLKRTFLTLRVSDDIQRIIQDTILPGLQHIIEHEDDIVQHVMTNFGVLYYAAKDLPLHTGHIKYPDADAYRQLLHRLIENIIGAFYVCQEAGKLTEFFDQLTQGYCLEGRTRSVLNWAAKFSEIKPFDDFMGERIKEYLAYQEHMFHETVEEATDVDKAVHFILTRYDDFPCQPHPEYAPEGNVTGKGVAAYLENILCYEKQEGKNDRCVIS